MAVRHAGRAGCVRPIRLRGTTRDIDPDTGEIISVHNTEDSPDQVIYLPCGDRPESVCPPCAETCRADTYQLIRAGLAGGKGMPESVAIHPCVFATFTAPSFGPVDTRAETADGTVARCRPLFAVAQDVHDGDVQWATPLEALLLAERAALLSGRDEEFMMLVTIAYTGMRWGETIGLERDLLLPSLINVEWQLREISGVFHRLPPKDDSYRSTHWEPYLPVDLPPFLADLLMAQAKQRSRERCACVGRPGGSGRYVVPQPGRLPLPAQQLRPARLPPSVRRAI